MYECSCSVFTRMGPTYPTVATLLQLLSSRSRAIRDSWLPGCCKDHIHTVVLTSAQPSLFVLKKTWNLCLCIISALSYSGKNIHCQTKCRAPISPSDFAGNCGHGIIPKSHQLLSCFCCGCGGDYCWGQDEEERGSYFLSVQANVI